METTFYKNLVPNFDIWFEKTTKDVNSTLEKENQSFKLHVICLIDSHALAIDGKFAESHSNF